MVKRNNLLLVENDRSIREALAKLLSAENYEVFSATSCREAILLGSQSKIDVVLLDLNMGDEDGWDAFQALKVMRPELPIVVASTQPDRLVHPSAADASGALEKPFDVSVLLSLLLATRIGSVEGKSRRSLAPLALAGLMFVLTAFQAVAVPPTPEFRINSLAVENGNAVLSWQGGNATNQVQAAPTIDGPWIDIGSPTTETTLAFPAPWPTAFYRLKTIDNAGADLSPLTVSLTSPSTGTLLSSTVTLSANVVNTTDGNEVSMVEFYCDADVFLGAATAPYNYAWDSTSLADGEHRFYCKAYDVAGNVAISAVSSATVNNVSTTAGRYVWAKDIRGNGVPDTAHVNGVAVDHQGNSIVVGNFAGTVNFDGTSLTSAGGQDAFVAKYSADGVLQWAKRFGDIFDQIAYGVSLDSADNIVVVGSFAGTLSFGGGLLSEVPTPSFYYAQTDIFVVKLNASGGHVWSRSFGSSGTEAAYGVTVDGAGDVILTGNYGIPPTTAQLDFGGGALGNAGAMDMFVAKLAGADGSYRWAVHHGNTDGTYSHAVYANGICADRNGDVAVVGYFSGGTIDLGGGDRVGAGGSDVFLAKYSGMTGEHLWSKTIGAGGSEIGKGVAIDANNNVIITGGFNGTVDFGGTLLTAPQSTGIFVAKYNIDGRQVWSRGFGGSYTGQDVGYGIAVDGAGNIGFTGTVQGSYVDFGGGPLYGDGTLNVFAAKLSADGNYVWGKRFKTGATQNYGCAAAFDSSGNLFTGGYFGGTTDFGGGTVTSSSSLQDGFLVKYSP
jgi:DNA-binding response OmpR family regulator